MDDILDLSEWDGEYVYEHGCCDDWKTPKDDVVGVCSSCGYPVDANGDAASGCNWSPVECHVCGHAPCDGYC